MKKPRRKVDAEPLYDVYEVAEYLKVDHTTVRCYIKRGSLESIRLDKTGPIRIKLSALKAFVDTEPEPQTSRTYQPRNDVKHLTLIEAWDLRRKRGAS